MHYDCGVSYSHRQTSPLFLLLVVLVLLLGVVSFQVEADLVRGAIRTVIVAIAYLAGSFVHLEVTDRGDHLLARFGPLPSFYKRVYYAELQSVEPGRSKLIDGWGVHWVPTRGWTFNLWGFDCVELMVSGQPMRIGTDDVDQLVAFLRGKIEASVHANR